MVNVVPSGGSPNFATYALCNKLSVQAGGGPGMVVGGVGRVVGGVGRRVVGGVGFGFGLVVVVVGALVGVGLAQLVLSMVPSGRVVRQRTVPANRFVFVNAPRR